MALLFANFLSTADLSVVDLQKSHINLLWLLAKTRTNVLWSQTSTTLKTHLNALPVAKGSRTSVSFHQPPIPFLANRRQNQETKLTKVFELPLNEFCNRYVNLEFLYGTCPPPFVPSVFPLLSLSCLSPNAAITSPSALKLLLIFCVSFTLSFSGNPFWCAKLTFSRSLPARSTKFKQPEHFAPVPPERGAPCSLEIPTWVPDIRRMKTECERDERSLTSVAATLRRECARERRVWTWEGLVRGTVVMLVTRVVCVLGSCLISCFFLLLS